MVESFRHWFFVSGGISALMLAISLLIPCSDDTSESFMAILNFLFAGSIIWTTIVAVAKLGPPGILAVIAWAVIFRGMGHMVYTFMYVDGRDDFDF